MSEPSGKFNGAGLEALLSQLRDAVAFVDPLGNVLLTNQTDELPAVPAVSGMPDLGDLFEIFHPDGRQYETAEWPVLRSVRTGEIVVDEQFFRLAPDGSRRSFSASSAPIYGKDGDMVAAVLVARDVSEETRSREQLAYLLPMLDHTEDAIIAVDPGRHVTAWNSGAERMYGWSAEEVLGRHLPDFVRMEMGDEQLARVRLELEELGRWRGEASVQRKDGSRVSIEAISVAIRDHDGEIIGYLGIHRDVSERKQRDERLAYHASLLDNVEDGVIATDAADFCIIAWNEGAERLYGFTAEDVLGRPAREVASYPGDSSRVELERELLETGRTRTEFTAHRKDCSPIEVELVAVAVRGRDGEITGYLGIHRDITERKRAEAALREAHHQTETVLESITDVFVALDADWRYAYLNRRALDRLRKARGEDVPLDDLLGRRLWDVFPEYVGTTFDHELHRAVREQRTVVFEGYAHATDSWIEVHAYPSRDGGLSIYSRDITERKHAQEELQHRISQQAAVAELGLKALEEGRLQPLMREAVTLVSRTLGVDYAKVDELHPGGEQLLVRAGTGWREGVVGSAMLPAGRGSPAGYALLIGRPVIVDDMEGDNRFEVPALLRGHEVLSAIIVVIATRGKPFGTLAAMSAERRRFSEDDVDFMQSVANVLAAAVERAEADRRVDGARQAERSRIARDLHDEALRELTDVLAVAAMSRPASAQRQDDQRWAALITSLRRVGQQLRSAIYDLTFSADEGRAFADLIAEMVAIQAEATGDRRLELHGAEALPTRPLGHRGNEALCIVREAITNARRHSGATTIRVDAGGSSEEVLRVEVRDDGDWPDRAATLSSGPGTGIASMLERADLLGAELQIEDPPGGGTRVCLELTLFADEQGG